ncbi:response regulator transcription factor [Desulfoscipio geothermicus]|uniref:Stage 0 sporulation protein A homolog n=1 Tax=Desulfoscipio geothermicus DSM 3669 TaxID=1121426 RepID=A0A1I6E9P0_9FIRM|nr:response regulator transcription factor [Desulfoscipio geothermicus]SFR14450.1 two-component system, OmpR family, alkaline phosphatase synthesis response regulator PhoP [Desulfoscipio geothermicus DSM 3669]
MPRILVVDDEKNIVELIKFNLEREGFQVLTAYDGQEAVRQAQEMNPDLIILDVMLPIMDGLEVCRRLNRNTATRNIPIIMLSAKGDELDKILGLEIGADDYVTKPFSPRELVARVKARLRRLQPGEDEKGRADEGNRLALGRLVIDQDRFEVLVDGERQELTPKEFELLRFIATEPGRVFSREHLLEKIWGYDFAGDSRTVDVHIRHLRQKLEKYPGMPQYIETVRGVGYRFKEVPK